MSLYFSIQAADGQDDSRTYSVPSDPYFTSGSGDIVSNVSNWQAALVESQSANETVEFHVTGARNSAITASKGNESSSAVINGLQIMPVMEFIQPGVNLDNTPVEYGPVPPGDYLLLHVHGGVNVGGSQPRYAGGFYRFVFSTENSLTGPKIVRLHHPEIGRYNTGPEVVEAYSGKAYTFTHTGGYVQFTFDDISGHYTDNTVTTGTGTGDYARHGLNYADTTTANPIAPVFALIDIAALGLENGSVNPPLFCPAFGLIPPSGQSVELYSTTPGTDIYYTKTEASEGFEPLDPDVPGFDEDGDPVSGTLLYTGPIIVTEGTKFKAVAKLSGLRDSPLSYIHYYGKQAEAQVTHLVGTSSPEGDNDHGDDDTVEDTVADVLFTPASTTLPLFTGVSLLSPTPGASIYYTASTTVDVDGVFTGPADPSTSSTLYTGPIAVSVPTKIKAFAVKSGLISSAITFARYTEVTNPETLVEFSLDSGEYSTEEFSAGLACELSETII